MNVAIKFEKVIDNTDEYVIFLISGRKITFAKTDFIPKGNKTILVDHNLAKNYGMQWRLCYHIPEYLTPSYNQKCIDELKC